MPADEGLQISAPTAAGPTIPGKTTLLMYACSQGDLQQVKRILQNQPTSAVQRDRTLKTALHYCAGGNSRPATNSYYTNTKSDFSITNVNNNNNNNITPGGEPGLAHCADLLVMAAPALVDTRDADGFTPLHLAVISGNMQLVNFLLANGADINALDAEKHSVVHWATVCGETGALGAVLAAGAQVSTPDVHGGYPLHYAAQMCGSEKSDIGLQVLHILLSQPSISVIIEDNDGRQPLLWAASAGSARAVLALVRAGATVEASDKDGLTALHCAASRGHTDTLDTLLTLCGATPDVIDTNGCTALHYSVTLGHADATALLLAHGADPNRQDRKGRSPAHCGCAKGQLETVRQLGVHAANLWLRNARGDLPLHEAAASGRRPLVRWLLDQRPSQVNARNNDGRCPLHLAALNDNADMCKILLDAGAQVNPILRTSKNVFMTPLDCALQRGFRSTAKFLQLHGGVPASRLANTPSTLRLGTEISSNFGSASNIHIREDITVFGGSSSETDLEDAQKKDSRPRRKTVRRRTTHRYDQKRDHTVEGDGIASDLAKRDKSKVKDNKSESDGKVKSGERTVKSEGKRLKKKQLHSDISPSESDLASPDNNNKGAVSKKDKSVSRNKSKTRQKQNNEEYENGHVVSNLENENQSNLDRKKSKKVQQINETNEISEKESRKIARKSAKSIDSKHKEKKKKEDKDKLGAESSENQNSDRSGTLNKKSKKSDISDSDQQKISDSDRKGKTTVDSSKHRSKSRDSKKKHKSDSSSNETRSKVEEKELQKSTDKDENKNVTSLLKPEDKTETQLTENNQDASVNLQEKDLSSSGKQDEEQMEKLKPEETQNVGDNKKLLNEESELLGQTIQPDQISIQSKLSEGSPSKTIVVEAAVHHLPKGISPEDFSEGLSITVESKEDTKQSVENLEENKKTEINDENNTIKEETVKSDHLAETVQLNNENKDKLVASEENLKISETTSEEISSKANEDEEKSKPVETPNKSEEISQVDKVNDVSLENEINKASKESGLQTIEEQSNVEDSTNVIANQNEELTVNNKEVTSNDQSKKEDTKQELNIDLSLKKFEETAGLHEAATDIDENENLKTETISESKSDDSKQKKYRKKLKTPKNGIHSKENDVKTGENDLMSSSTSREGSSTESDSEIKKSKQSLDKTEHKSFKVLKDDVAFEVLNDSAPKETRRVKHKSKKRLKEIERLNESATSSPEMLESIRSRTKSRDRDFKSVHLLENLTLPVLPEHKRPESNLSAPNLSSIYSDNEHKSGSNSEVDDAVGSATRKRRFKRRKLRLGSKSAGSDYESSNLIDSGFEPSPRSSRIPKRKVMSERGVNMTSVTQQIQSNIRKYHMERKIFQHLLDLKRLQIRSGQSNEAMLVKRAIDAYHNSVAATVGGGRYMKKDYTYKGFEQFLYQSLRMLQKSPTDQLKGLPETPDNPLLCTQSTHRCLHATHAYTGIPCAAYLPKMNHHTMPKIGFTPRSTSSFLPQINSKGKSVTLELCHGNDKQVISLPADRLDHNKRYYVTFTVKGQDALSPIADQQDTTTHRHAKSV